MTLICSSDGPIRLLGQKQAPLAMQVPAMKAFGQVAPQRYARLHACSSTLHVQRTQQVEEVSVACWAR